MGGDGRAAAPGDRVVVYADFDGVLVTERHRREVGGHELNPYACADLADVLEEADALLVVCSTWRMDDDCRDRMARAGLPMGRLHPDWRTAPVPADEVDLATGDVVRADRPTRQEEIEDHVARNGVRRYAVVDDDGSIGGDPGRRQVRPRADRGLAPRDVEALRAMLRAMAGGAGGAVGGGDA